MKLIPFLQQESQDRQIGNEDKDKNDIPKEEEHNDEISISYVSTNKHWSRNNAVMNEIFAYSIAIEMISDENDLESRTVEECCCRSIGKNEKSQCKQN